MVEKIKKEKRRKVLVTGSAGMLGTGLCKKLSDDYDVIGLDVNPPAASIGISLFVRCDITNRDKTIESVVSAKPDLVIHAAAWTDVDECEKDQDKAKRVNVEGTENVSLVASELGVPIVYISTDFVFDGAKNSPYNEEDKPNPLNFYAKTKLEGEKKVSESGDYLILRTGWLYGKNGKNFVDTVLGIAKKEKELKVVNDQVGSPTYTKDFTGAIARLLKVSKMREIYHISNKGAVSWFEYAKEILKIHGMHNIEITPISAEELNRPAKRPAFSVLDNNKFEKTINFIMRPWKEALREYISEKK